MNNNAGRTIWHEDASAGRPGSEFAKAHGLGCGRRRVAAVMVTAALALSLHAGPAYAAGKGGLGGASGIVPGGNGGDGAGVVVGNSGYTAATPGQDAVDIPPLSVPGGAAGTDGPSIPNGTTMSGTQAGGNGVAGGDFGLVISGAGGGGGGAGSSGINGFGIGISASVTGGSGGAGGSGAPGLAIIPAGSGGGGGGGGDGLTGNNLNLTITGAITGGKGGKGGNGGDGNIGGNGGNGGGGGGGGAGISGNNSTITNSGIITGGTGGAGGTGGTSTGGIPGTAGMAGSGGAGISGSDLTIINSGAITGGWNGNHTAQANAITFTGGANSLELQAGWSIDGNVVGQAGSTNTLILGGTGNSSFDVANIAPAGSTTQQYQGFSAFHKTGTSTWALTSTTTAVTPWTISGGTLQIGSDGALGDPSGAVTFDGGTLQTTANITTSRDFAITGNNGTIQTDAGTTYRVNGTITDATGTSGALTKTGAGTLALFGNNSYSGGTTLSAGRIDVGHNNALGTGGLTMADGATLGFAATGLTVANDIDLTGRDVFDTMGNDDTLSGVISGAGALVKTGDGTLTLADGHSNTYSGGTVVLAGTLAGNITENTDLVVRSGATYDTNGAARSVNGLYGRGSVMDSDGLTVQRGAFRGVISGAGSLTKTTDGTLTLFGANDYTGLTEVLAGTLALSGVGMISDTLALYDGTIFDTSAANVNNPSVAPFLASMDVHGSATWQGNMNMAGQTMNFYVPEDMGNGGMMLDVTGTANIAGATVNVGIEGTSTALGSWDHVVLVNAAELNGTPANSKSASAPNADSPYDFSILIPEQNQNQLWAVVPLGVGPVHPAAKSLSEGFLAGAALLNQGGDLVAGWGTNAAMDAAFRAEQLTGWGIFGIISGGWSRYDTGSHTDISSISLMTGVSKRMALQPGSLVLGLFFEYGNGAYDTYTLTHGDGDLYHLGGGILGRMDFTGSKTGHFYTEGSARVGSVRNDYTNSELRVFTGRTVNYDSSSTYYGIHLGVGYLWNLTSKASLDLYTKYFWTHQEGDSVVLSTGDPVDFDNINSHRLRVGTRFAYAVNDAISPYVGLAYEQEFDGDATASASGYPINEPSLNGGTGMGEIGLTHKATANLPVFIDLGVQGYVGMREGVAGTLRLRYEF